MGVNAFRGGRWFFVRNLPREILASIKLPFRLTPNRAVNRARASLEGLEQRQLLAAHPYISEFMASNDETLADSDGAYSDWIEIANPGAEDVNLDGYFLTDSDSALDKWRFPSVVVPAGGYLVVFASGKDRTTGPELHTSFVLDDAGEYLALVAPNGQLILSEFEPTYPRQLTDVSYGIATDFEVTSLLSPEAPLRAWVPTDSSLGTLWTAVEYDDSGWIAGTAGVGFDIGTAPPRIPGFTVNMVDVAGDITDITVAQRILNDPEGSGVPLQSQMSRDYAVVNHGPGGNFGTDQLLPNGAVDGEQYALRATATVFIPAGTWSIDVGSDDGFLLKIPGVSFTNRFNEASGGVPLPIPTDTLVYAGLRGHGHTSGTFTVPAGGLSTTLTLDFYENYGGDDVELSVASGTQTFNGNFVLLSDAVLPGWQVKTTSSAPPPNFDSLIGTNVQPQMLNRNASAYVRIPLREVVNPLDFDTLRLRIKYDDGFVAYLNGQVIAARNAPQMPVWDSAASAEHPDEAALVYEDINIALPPGLLRQGIGTNVLAIQGLNQTAGDGDFLVYPELQGLKTLESAQRYFTAPTPGAANNPSSMAEVVADTKFSHDRGFYDAPFQLAITTETQDAQIRYTLDGSAPTATTGLVYSGPVTISRTTVVRAAAFKPGAIATSVDAQTYLFLDDVIRQSPNGQAPQGWPTSWSPNTTDYGMDPDVVNNPAYSGTIKDDLKSIPTFSIVMDLKDLFGPTGIYSNPGGDGRAWERPASLELIYPDGRDGFQVNAGLRIRGGFSRSTDNPKHAFRVFFRDEYGDGKLDFPLFTQEGPEEFDGFDLRTFQNYSWSFQGDGNGIFMRDQFSRDAQIAMGWPSERGDYYHLYINGQYWGLFNTAERPEASYGATYFGGTPEDYDVIKPSPDNGYSVYATDGNMLAWTDLWNQLRGNMSLQANYMRVQGLNPDGTRNPSYPVLLDVDNLIDYMLVIFYGGNLDAPLSNFLGNVSPNNFFAMRNRNGDEGFKFFVHDAEHTLLNVNEDRTGPYNTISSDPNQALAKSNPQYMFQLLRPNPEFRLRVADRIHKWFFNNGVLTPAKATELFNRRKDEIYRAVVGESARWGDAKRGSPLTRDNDWVSAVNRVLSGFFPQRTNVVFNQLKTDGYYPNTGAPEFNQHGGVVPSGFSLTINRPAGTTGTIYYTLDGTDPRLRGGAVTPGALVYTGPVSLPGTTTVKARILNGDEWSALTDASFYHDLAALRVTEIMYNPAAPAAGPYTAQDFEFIELLNTGDTTLDLKGVAFTGGISYAFPTGSSLGAGQRLILARNAAAFESRYGGIELAGVYTGSLDNAGEQLTITGPGGVLLDFEYNDWYAITDGGGYSLVAVNPTAPMPAYEQKSNWRPSDSLNGAPGEVDPGINPESVVINEALTNTTGPDGDWIELYNTTNQPIDLGGWFLSDDASNLRKYQIQPGTVIPAGGYLVLTQAQHFGVPGGPGVNVAFGLSSAGDEIYLSNSNGADDVGGYRERADFSAAAPEVTFGRHVKQTGGTDFTAMSAPTRGSGNALPLVGPVVISEIMYHPAAAGDEYIEIHNLTGSNLPLYDPDNRANVWKFTEGVEFAFPADTELPAFSYALVVGMAPDAFRSKYSIPADVPIFGPYTGLLDNTGETLKLARPGVPAGDLVPYITADQVNYDNSAPWPTTAAGGGPSLSRVSLSGYGNDSGNWVAGPPGGTPGAAFVPPASPSLLSGTGVSGQLIRLNWTDNSTGEDGFRIERSADGINFTVVATVGANTNTFDDNKVASGTFYTYRVQAFSNAGNSGYSNTFSVSTPGLRTYDLLSITDEWRYNQARALPAADWFSRNYNDNVAGWQTGRGLFYYENAALPAAKNTELNPGPSGDRTMTYYFRKHFTLPVDPSAVTSLLARLVVDDGIAIYLNGNPNPFALGMPAAPYNYSTPANRTVGDAAYEGPVNLDPLLLVPGDNVIAVEVHQINNTSSDIVFGLELEIDVSLETVSAQITPVAPDPRTASVDSVTITFSEPVTGFDLGDLRLTRDNGANLITAAQTLSSSDGRSWTLGNLASLTGLSGNYLLMLSANGSGITGSAAGRFLGADAMESFQVTSTSVQGTPLNDAFYVRVNGDTIEVFNTIPPGAKPIWSIPLSQATTLRIEGGGGDDIVRLASQLPFVPVFVGGAGNDRLVVDGGTWTYTADLATSGVEELALSDSAVLNIQSAQHLNALTLEGSSRVNLAPGSGVLRTRNLSIGAGTVLDLADNDLVIQATASSKQQVLSQVSAAVKSARGSSANWSGKGISSSAAAGNSLTGLAVVLNDRGDGSALMASFAGEAVDANCILVKYTWNGDADLNGKIDAADYFLVDSGFIAQATNYRNGDLDFSGKVDAADYFLIDSAFLGQSGVLSAKPAKAVVASTETHEVARRKTRISRR